MKDQHQFVWYVTWLFAFVLIQTFYGSLHLGILIQQSTKHTFDVHNNQFVSHLAICAHYGSSSFVWWLGRIDLKVSYQERVTLSS